MATVVPRYVYVISDIHNHATELLKMIKKIDFNFEQDALYILGDVYDRGFQPLQVYEFLKKHQSADTEVLSPGLHVLRGNHDHWLAQNLARYLDGYKSFSAFNSLEIIIQEADGKTMLGMFHWISSLPLHLEFEYNSPYGKRMYLLAHAMTAPLAEINDKDSRFFLMGDDIDFSYLKNGVGNGTVSLVGHNPTEVIRDWMGEEQRPVKSEIWFNRKEDPSVIAVDCGCGFRKSNGKARLGCIRLNDYKMYYV